jgi:VWFA-related protein
MYVCVVALGVLSVVRAHAQFSNMDLIQIYVSEQKTRDKDVERQRIQENKALIDSGEASVLDFSAPYDALGEFNRSLELIKAQNTKEAIKHLQKAIAAYPKFVSAHVNLGIAYLDQNDTERARSEFETATKLDDKFPRSFLNLGVLEMSEKDFAGAQSQLEKAAELRPKDALTLATLARAQNENHHYELVLETVQRVHDLPHKEFGDVHYVGAAAAMALKDFTTMQRELGIFLNEAPASPFAPNARHNLELLAHNKDGALPTMDTVVLVDSRATETSSPVETFPNSENLKMQLSALGDESEGCDECDSPEEPAASASGNASLAAAGGVPILPRRSQGQFTIRTTVDEVVQFFSVSRHGRLVNGLQASNVQIRDDDKPPAKLLQFSPQSKLPLRLALIVDTSGSVQDRFKFEKQAASKFLQKAMGRSSDLGFVAGFASEIKVTQDFTADSGQLSAGLEKLTNGGGTRLFDAFSFSCQKLAAYPEGERVARVLVVLSDGEDNSSHRTLKQSIHDAELAGVTVYTVSTKEGDGTKTAADRVLEVLAERTGGEAMFPGDTTTLGRTLDKLGDLIRSRYLVAYSPASFVPNGSYRTIRITAEKDGKRLQVRARKGYYARLAIPKP